MPNKIVNLKVDEISNVDNPANDREWLVIKNEDGDYPNKGGEINDMDLDEILEKLEEQDEELAEAVQNKFEEFTEKVEEKKEDSSEEGEEIDKSNLPEDVRKQIEQMEDKLEKTETMARKEREKRLEVEFNKRAKEYDELGKVEKISSLLRKADEVGDDFLEDLESILQSAKERISEGDLFKEAGDSGDEIEDPVSELEKKAKEYRENHSDVDTIEKAKVKILEQNPDLYDAYRRSK